MNQPAYVPDRGDAIWINLDPQSGREHAGRRPAIVLSPSQYNGRVGLALICPITNRVKRYPFEVEIPAGLPVTGVVLADHVKSLDWRTRQAQFVCAISEDVVRRIVQRITPLLMPSNGPGRR